MCEFFTTLEQFIRKIFKLFGGKIEWTLNFKNLNSMCLENLNFENN